MHCCQPHFCDIRNDRRHAYRYLRPAAQVGCNISKVISSYSSTQTHRGGSRNKLQTCLEASRPVSKPRIRSCTSILCEPNIAEPLSTAPDSSARVRFVAQPETSCRDQSNNTRVEETCRNPRIPRNVLRKSYSSLGLVFLMKFHRYESEQRHADMILPCLLP